MSLRDPIVRAQIPPDRVQYCAIGAPSSVIMVRSNESGEFALLVVSVVLMSFTIFNFISIYYYISETKGLSLKNTKRLGFIHSILLVPPVSSVLALIICIAPRLNLYLDFIRVMTFAFSMNGLFNLIFDYFEGFENFLKVVKKKKWTMQVFICRFCCCCFPLQRSNRAWFSNLWWGAYQPPLIRAGLTLVSVLLLAEGLDSTIIGLMSLFINLFSTAMGVFCLAILSENLQDVGSMFMIREKFFNFRLSLIIINVQPLVIGLCTLQCVYPLSGSVRGTLLHNQLVIIEMLMLGLFQRYLWMYSFTEDSEIEKASEEELLRIPESAGQRIRGGRNQPPSKRTEINSHSATALLTEVLCCQI
ncbi:Oidioi.mRNA.OKI2018_I69.chr2.g6845.t1.cds [Oikopleura dioica]|uniref:Oidioi.mRNA.OKI2018_I69.chr2.g6845.t1.cds n=1 Tax=Oikopleura dioica TaxID=34765 RepID=A0ABN7T4A4_OIKDI|nr:Oidioi.mRNA.OKI2018_I69.chr2.g6845.t1.cds [Oikopleura dioica]